MKKENGMYYLMNKNEKIAKTASSLVETRQYAATRSCFVTVVVCCNSGFGGIIMTRGFSSVIQGHPFQ